MSALLSLVLRERVRGYCSTVWLKLQKRGLLRHFLRKTAQKVRSRYRTAVQIRTHTQLGPGLRFDVFRHSSGYNSGQGRRYSSTRGGAGP